MLGRVFHHFKKRTAEVGACGLNNQANREAWLERILAALPPNQRILDAGAGELQYKRFCTHLDYVSQDFSQYDGDGDSKGLHMGGLETRPKTPSAALSSASARLRNRTYAPSPRRSSALHLRLWAAFSNFDRPKGFSAGSLDLISDITEIPEPDSSFDAVMCVEVFGFSLVELAINGNYFEYLGQEMRRVATIAECYSLDRLEAAEAAAIKTCLAILERFSARDQGSAELLSYGCHVLARKNAGS